MQLHPYLPRAYSRFLCYTTLWLLFLISSAPAAPPLSAQAPTPPKTLSFFADTDGDGYGDPATRLRDTTAPAGYVPDSTDNCPTTYNPSQTDSDRDGTGDACADTATLGTEFLIAAECATVGSSFELQAAEGTTTPSYAIYRGPAATDAPPPDLPANRLRFTVDAEAGDYYLFACIRAPDVGADSYWIRINDGQWFKWWRDLLSPDFAWKIVSGQPFDLPQGRSTIDFAYRESNVALAKLAVNAAGIIPEGSATVAPVDCPGSMPAEAVSDSVVSAKPNTVSTPDGYWLEAESATVGNAFVTRRDTTASAGSAVVYRDAPAMDEPPADLPRNLVRFTVDELSEGEYQIYARIKAPDGNADSFWVRINDGDWIKWAAGLRTPTFAWKSIAGRTYTLPAGTTTVDFAYREPGTELDSLYLTRGEAPPP